MSVCLSNKFPNVYHSLSLTPFIKHLASTNIGTWPPRRRTITASANHTSPLLEALTSRQKEQISLYVDALLEWNQRMNLTAVTDANEVRTRHVEDSLAIIPPIHNSYSSHCSSTSSSDSLSLVDVGSGAGLPGLIFAIACPGWKVTLLESMNKRCVFLEHAISVTGLSNVEVLRARAESVGQSVEFREMFDVAVARAVAEMRILAEYCLPLVRVGGLFVAAKGPNPQEEVKDADKAIKLLGASILQLCSVESHSPYGQRTAIICLKERPTSKKYPRDPGTPAKIVKNERTNVNNNVRVIGPTIVQGGMRMGPRKVFSEAGLNRHTLSTINWTLCLCSEQKRIRGNNASKN